MRHTANTNNRAFIVSLSSELKSSLDRDSFCARLLSFGDAAIALRQGIRLREVGNILSSLPLPESLRAIGDYYTGLATGNSESLRRAIEHAPARYRARAILALGAVAAKQQDRKTELNLYGEAIRAARDSQDLYTAIHAHKMLAIRRSTDGDHSRTIQDLESLWPMVRLIAKQDPATYLDVLNSLAVELLEVGKTDEASRAIQLVQASPLLAFNPEWQQTAQEIEERQAQPLIIAVPAVCTRVHKRRAVAVITISACRPRRPISWRASSVKPQIIFHLTTRNRAGPLGPRAPPVL